MSDGTGTIVAETYNCEVLLTSFGFYTRCTKCPYVSEFTSSKSKARMYGVMHDEDDSRPHPA
jgi:hypothetical protein